MRLPLPLPMSHYGVICCILVLGGLIFFNLDIITPAILISREQDIKMFQFLKRFRRLKMKNQRVYIMILFVVLIGVLVSIGTRVEAKTPAQTGYGVTIPYSGRLTTDAGEPVVDGVYELNISLFADATGGEPLWSETHANVDISGGAFGIILGSITPLLKETLDTGAQWLAISVCGPGDVAFTLLSPRQQLSPVSVSASSCAHTHLSEWWTGSSVQAGLIVDNRTGTGDGIRGYASATGSSYGGVYGVNFAAGPGVYGRSDGGGPGVAGYSSGRGVYGSGADGVVGESSVNGKSGVYGNNTGATGYGVTGRSGSYYGVYAWGNDSSASDIKGDLLLQGNYGEIFTFGGLLDLYSNDRVVIDLDNDNNSPNSFFRILGGTDNILWTVSEPSGLVVAAGNQASISKTADYGQRLTYAVEGTGVWLEDLGTATLSKDGEASVLFDPMYAQSANLEGEYQVFLTAQCDQPVLLYIVAKNATDFVVRGVTLDGKPVSCSFDYRVVAPRLGYETDRMEEYTTEGESK